MFGPSDSRVGIPRFPGGIPRLWAICASQVGAHWLPSDETTAFSSIKKISRIYWTSTFGHVMGAAHGITGTGKTR